MKINIRIVNVNILIFLLLITFARNNDQLNFFWPSMDMITFYSKFFSDNQYVNDFMTICYEKFTGRYYFGFITGSIYNFFSDWYNFLIFYRVLIFLFLPISWFLALKVLFRKDNLNISIIVILIYTAINRSWRDIFSFATWNPYFFHFHPSTFASMFTLLGIYFLYKKNKNIFLASIFIILGSFSHPIFSFSILFIFNYFIFIIEKDLKNILISLSLNLSTIIFQSFQGNFGSLDISSYVLYFSQFHPHHYLPSSQEGLLEDIFIIAVLFVLLNVFPGGSNKKVTLILSISFYSLFVLGILLQYYFVELYPFSKTIVLASPSRFSSLVYWMFVICFLQKFRLKLSYFENKVYNFMGFKSFIILILVNIALLFTIANDLNSTKIFHKSTHLSQDEIKVFKWVKENTQSTDTFLVIGEPNFNYFFTSETSRGQYLAVGYPFNDKCIVENYERKAKFANREIQQVINDLILINTTEFEYIITNKSIKTDDLEIIYLNGTYSVIKIKP